MTEHTFPERLRSVARWIEDLESISTETRFSVDADEIDVWPASEEEARAILAVLTHLKVGFDASTSFVVTGQASHGPVDVWVQKDWTSGSVPDPGKARFLESVGVSA